MKIIAVMPVKGREPLLKLTVSRLLRQVDMVICAGHTESEAKSCEGALFYYCEPDMALGAKWQICVDVAMSHNPDAILIMGSSDMISDNWIETMQYHLSNGYVMAGTSGIHFVDVQRNEKKELLMWCGYDNERRGEAIGTGRMISAEAIRLMQGNVFERWRNKSLDYSTMQRIATIPDRLSPKRIKVLKYNDECPVKCLSISYYMWENMHNFNQMTVHDMSFMQQNCNDFLQKWFPEMLNFK